MCVVLEVEVELKRIRIDALCVSSHGIRHWKWRCPLCRCLEPRLRGAPRHTRQFVADHPYVAATSSSWNNKCSSKKHMDGFGRLDGECMPLR